MRVANVIVRTEFPIRIVILVFLAAAMFSNRSARADSSPEILANTRSLDGYKPEFHRGKIPPEFIDRIRATTWHNGCPVDPKDLRMLTLSYWSFDGKPAMGKLIVNIVGVCLVSFGFSEPLQSFDRPFDVLVIIGERNSGSVSAGEK